MNLRSFRVCLLSMLVAMALLLPTGSVKVFSLTPREITVCPVGCDYVKIQEAIIAAQPGDTILIFAGIYQENLTIDKSLKLRGEDWEKVIVDGSLGCREGQAAIHVTAQQVRIEGFTVTRCSIGIGIRGTAAMGRLILSKNAIGLEVWDLAQASLEDSLILNNTVGVEVWAMAKASITNTAISANGIGVKILRGSSVAIIKDIISKNGLGMEIWDSDEVLIEGSIISESEGDGLWAWGPTSSMITVQNNKLFHNKGNGIRLGAAPYRPDSIRAEIKDNIIQKNKGCGIWLDDGDAEEIKLTGQGNKISENQAGDLCPPTYFWPSGFLTGEGGS